MTLVITWYKSQRKFSLHRNRRYNAHNRKGKKHTRKTVIFPPITGPDHVIKIDDDISIIPNYDPPLHDLSKALPLKIEIDATDSSSDSDDAALMY